MFIFGSYASGIHSTEKNSELQTVLRNLIHNTFINAHCLGFLITVLIWLTEQSYWLWKTEHAITTACRNIIFYKVHCKFADWEILNLPSVMLTTLLEPMFHFTIRKDHNHLLSPNSEKSKLLDITAVKLSFISLSLEIHLYSSLHSMEWSVSLLFLFKRSFSSKRQFL